MPAGKRRGARPLVRAPPLADATASYPLACFADEQPDCVGGGSEGVDWSSRWAQVAARLRCEHTAGARGCRCFCFSARSARLADDQRRGWEGGGRRRRMGWEEQKGYIRQVRRWGGGDKRTQWSTLTRIKATMMIRGSHCGCLLPLNWWSRRARGCLKLVFLHFASIRGQGGKEAGGDQEAGERRDGGRARCGGGGGLLARMRSRMMSARGGELSLAICAVGLLLDPRRSLPCG